MHVAAIGKIKGSSAYLADGLAEYEKRLRRYCQLSWMELEEETVRPSRTEAQVKEAEGRRLLACMERAAYRVVLSEHGRCYDSETFSNELLRRHPAVNPSNGGRPVGGPPTMLWVIGGPLGLAEPVLQRADWVVSLSAMTFPHQVVRLMLVEQLYRSFRILNGEPYHK